MSSPGTADPTPGKRAQKLLPYLLLLPPALLALPGPLALLADDPFPHLAGSGWMLLAFIPLTSWLLVRGFSVGQGAMLCGGLLLFAILANFRELSDPLEARRSMCQLFGLTVAFVGAMQLSKTGRRRLEFGAMWLSIAWTGFALALRLSDDAEHLAGVFGDTGSLSQAALPGAVVGAWYAATRSGGASFLGLVAAVLFVLHAGWTPVLAGGLTWVGAIIYSSMSSPWPKRHSRTRRILGVLAACGLGSLILFRGMPAAGDGLEDAAGIVRAQEEEPAENSVASATSSTLGGVGVRGYVWKHTLAMVMDQPLLGVGPGQFQAAFPPHRSDLESVRSRHGVCREENTEVEHAHSDPLEGLAEFGLLGGLVWLWILFRVGRASLQAVHSGEVHSTALGAAGIALCLNALVHAPLLANPVAGPLAFAIFGALVARSEPLRVTPTPKLRIGFAIVALTISLQAPALIQHGRALTTYIQSVRTLDGLQAEGDDEAEQAEQFASSQRALDSIERALAIAPRSAEARLLNARHEPDESKRYEAWLHVLEIRPYSVEAEESAGILKAQEGDLELARHHLERAAELSPTHPGILKNLVRLELQTGDLERGKAWLERLRENGCVEAEWQADLGASLVLRDGRMEAGAWLLRGAPLLEISPEELHASYKDESSADPQRVSAALECLAQLLWARQHAANGSFQLALRNYRQAQRQSRAWQDGGALSLRLERAAAEAAAGRAEAAQEVLGSRLLEIPSAKETLDRLPEWARTALEDLR